MQVLLDSHRYLTLSASNEAFERDRVFFMIRDEASGFQFAKFLSPEQARLVAHVLTCAADQTEARVAAPVSDDEV